MAIKWKKTINADFKADLARGRIGELAFLHATEGTLIPTDGRTGDFMLGKHKVEVKNDHYDMNNTENFFMEVYSSGTKPGGAYQALEHGCKYYCYIYVPNAELFIFDTKALCERLDLLHDSRNLTLTSVGNRGYTTRGLKVHRDWLMDLVIEPSTIGLKYDNSKYNWYINYNKAEP